MSASLRYLLLLVGLVFVGGVASIMVQHHQSTRRAETTAAQLTGGDFRAGRQAILRRGCGACHEIPGIPGARGRVGPPLDGFARRGEIAGRLPNDPASLILWLRHPQQVSPGNGMPDQRIGEREGRDIAAYLYTLQ
ncbi:MAG TPA: c-type cytochrome [Sphingomonas sp.]|nr:c-type cytochrome [Sphingomonas sp.]